MSTRALDRAVDGGIAGAPADIAGQPDPDGVLRRPWTKGDGSEDHPGRADATLRTAELDKSPLQGVASAESFDGGDVGSGHLRERHEAGVDRHAIDEDRAGTALT